jgi:cell division septation protein DedD
MAGPVIQENPTQHTPPPVSQAPQNGGPQVFAPQQPFHPMAGGGSYMMPPPPYYPPPPMGGQQSPQNNKTVITMGRFSLFAIISAFVLMGAFTFLSGFLLGLWLESPKPSSSPSVPVSPQSSVVRSPQGQAAPQASTTPQGNAVDQMIGDAAGDAVGNYQLPIDVPDFLTPLVTAAQDAASQQAADRTQNIATWAYPSSTPAPAPQPTSVSPSPSQPLSQQSGPLPDNMPQPSPSLTPVAFQASPQDGKGNYTIQVGVFAAKDNAEKLKDQLMSSNHLAYVTEGKSPEGTPLYYVHTGRYQDYDTASQAISSITAQQNVPGAVLVKLSQQGKNAP